MKYQCHTDTTLNTQRFMRLKTSLFFILISILTVSEMSAQSMLNNKLYFGLHLITPENTNTGYSQNRLDYLANFSYEKKVVYDDINFSAKFSVEIETKTSDNTSDTQTSSTIKPYEAFVYLKKELLGIKIGQIDIGGKYGIIAGHQYMTRLGRRYAGTYGNSDQAQLNLALVATPMEKVEAIAAYSLRTDDVSKATTENNGNVSVLDLVARGDFDVIQLGLEIEYKSYENNKQNLSSLGTQNEVKGSESTLGFSLSFPILEEMIIPFINLGNSSVNDSSAGDKITTQEINLGADIVLTRRMGTTIGYEKLERTSTSSGKIYFGVKYSLLEDITVSGSYFLSDQKESNGFENIKDQLDLEVNYLF